MALNRNSIFVFKDETSTGLDTVPLNSLILVLCSGKLYQYDNNYDIINNTPISLTISNNLKEYIEGTTFSTALFYGGWNTIDLNTVTLFSESFTLKQPETTVGTNSTATGINVNGVGLFIGASSKTTIINNNGILVKSEGTCSGFTSRNLCQSAESGINALFYGGHNGSLYSNICSLVNYEGALVQSESYIGTARSYHSAAKANINALFYRGYDGSSQTKVTLISPFITLVQAETNVGNIANECSGIGFSDILLFYGGWNSSYLNELTFLSVYGTTLSADTSRGTSRGYLSSARINENALFFGGEHTLNAPVNTLTVLNKSGVLVKPEVNIGTSRTTLTGASL
jgi:hypothetical protein